MDQNPGNQGIIFRLTALWALNESGLGGMLHAVNFPFTGLTVGGLAVILIGLIAWYSKGSFKQILRATFLVILVKAAASPHTSFPAYISVGFQGLAGALLYRLLPGFSMASVIFGMVAMIESALQKFIIKTLIYGMAIWDALDLVFKSILKEFSLNPQMSFSLWLISAYTLVYAFWGIILGFWINALPKVLDNRRQEIMIAISALHSEQVLSGLKPHRKRKLLKHFLLLLPLIFILIAYWFFPQLKGNAWNIVIRSLAATLLLFYVLGPLIGWFLKSRIRKGSGDLQHLLSELPQLRKLASSAYTLSASKGRGLARIREFVIIMLVGGTSKTDG